MPFVRRLMAKFSLDNPMDGAAAVLDLADTVAAAVIRGHWLLASLLLCFEGSAMDMHAH